MNLKSYTKNKEITELKFTTLSIELSYKYNDKIFLDNFINNSDNLYSTPAAPLRKHAKFGGFFH